MDVELCIDTLVDKIPRDCYSFCATADVDGVMTLILVFNAGDDEEYLKTLDVPDDDILRQAVHLCLKTGVWPTHP